MYYKQTCPQCSKTLKVPLAGVGRKARCPYCRYSVVLEGPKEEKPPATETHLAGPLEPPPSGVPPQNVPQQIPAPELTSPPPSPGQTQGYQATSTGTNVDMIFSCVFGLLLAVGFYVLFVLPLYATYFGQLFLFRGWVPYVLVFLLGWSAAILILKSRKLVRQRESMLMDLLPTELGETINPENLDKFALHVQGLPVDPGQSFLVNRVLRGLEHFRVRRNSAEVASVLSSQSDIDANAVTSSYSLVKVFLWAIPILGFIGTVIGISDAVGGFSGSLGKAQDLSALKESLNSVTGGLATAFDTTLIALVMSIFVMFPTSSLQKAEEDLINWVDEYCNENLIRRLDEQRGDDQSDENYAEVIRTAITSAMAPHLAELETRSRKLEMEMDANLKKLDATGQSLSQQVVKGWNSVYRDQSKEFSSLAEHLHNHAQKLEQRAQDHQHNIEADSNRAVRSLEQSLANLTGSSQQAFQQIAASLQQTATAVEANSRTVSQGLEKQISEQTSHNQQLYQQAATSMQQIAASVETSLSQISQGIDALNNVLTALGEKQVIIQQQRKKKGWSLFGRDNGG